MSCCGCEETPARVTNLYRHQELQEMFTDLTGIILFSNTFICDLCVSHLEKAFKFKEKCLEIYSRSTDPEKLDGFSIIDSKDDTTFAQDEEMIVYETEYADDYIKTESVSDELSIAGDTLLDTPEAFIDEIESPIPKTRSSYTTELKEEAMKCAERTSNRQAAKILSINESCIRKWRLKKDKGHSDNSEPAGEQNVTEQVEVQPEESKKKNLKIIRNRKSYTCGQKLEVVECAEMTGNRKAAKIFSIDESCIRKWRINKEQLQQIHEERGTKRKPNLHWPELDKDLKIWVKDQMSKGALLKPAEIKAKSIEIATSLNLTNFKGTSSYIFKFMERYQIPGRPSKNPFKQKSVQLQ